MNEPTFVRFTHVSADPSRPVFVVGEAVVAIAPMDDGTGSCICLRGESHTVLVLEDPATVKETLEWSMSPCGGKACR